MNLTEAVKSGRKFRRPEWCNWCDSDAVEKFRFSREDLLASDYYVMPPTITSEYFDRATKRIDHSIILNFDHYAKELKNELGL